MSKLKNRKYYDWDMEELGEAQFINTGQFADGHMSYEIVDNENAGIFIQVRYENKLVMVRL